MKADICSGAFLLSLSSSSLWAMSMMIPLTDAVPAAAPLRFDENGRFQVAVFEDLHFGEGEDVLWGPQQDANTTRVMQSVLSTESPQLAVLNGDLITGENTYLPNATHYLDQLVAPLLSAGVPWASTYGNHDSDFNLSRAALFAREKRYRNSLTRAMVRSEDWAAGVTNYYLPVYPSGKAARRSDVPALILWFFDSRGGNKFQQRSGSSGEPVSEPNWVDVAVVEWFRETAASLRLAHGKVIPSLAFVHIPVNAFLDFQNAGVDPKREPGINDDVPLEQQGATGGQGGSSGFAYDGQDREFMKALAETEGLRAVFSGHDHGDDWCFTWSNSTRLSSNSSHSNTSNPSIHLCFGRHTGYGGYGSWTRGARQIVVSETLSSDMSTANGCEIETWVRLEDGSVSGRVTLNETYGVDEYPVVTG